MVLTTDFDEKPLADAMYKAYMASADGNYLMEKVKRSFYGKLVRDKLPLFKELHAYLIEHGHTVKNPYVYGDIDVGVWYENTEHAVVKIIAIESYCTCADDSTHIFIMRDWGESHIGATGDIKFLAVTAWPRQKKKRIGHSYGDYRDIKYPSIRTYRDYNFEFGCGDGRDVGYSFKYETIAGDKVEDAHWNEPRIMFALRTLQEAHFNVIELENREGQD